MPRARFVHVDPVIHVVASPQHPEERPPRRPIDCSQFQAWDMLSGRFGPNWAGTNNISISSVSIFIRTTNGSIISKISAESVNSGHSHGGIRSTGRFAKCCAKYMSAIIARLFIAETGAEDRRRAGWLRYVCPETEAAIRQGLPLHGLCLYPILNHPGWIDDRHATSLVGLSRETGRPGSLRSLSRELRHWQQRFENPA